MRNDFAGLVPGIAAERQPLTAKDNSDEALIAKIASGSRLAMQVLFARHHARIYRFVLRLLGSEALAEDITSEVFLGVWRQAHRFEARSAVTTWLLAIARYKALAELRRRPEACDEATADASDPADDPEATFEIKHRGEILRNCLTRLSPRHREIIDLVYYHEKSVQEAPPFWACPAIPSKPACSTPANGSSSCSPRKASWARWHSFIGKHNRRTGTAPRLGRVEALRGDGGELIRRGDSDAAALEPDPAALGPGPQLLVGTLARHADHLADLPLRDGRLAPRALFAGGQLEQCLRQASRQVQERDVLHLLAGVA